MIYSVLGFMQDWETYWEYKGLLALALMIAIILIGGIIENKISTRRKSHGLR